MKSQSFHRSVVDNSTINGEQIRNLRRTTLSRFFDGIDMVELTFKVIDTQSLTDRVTTPAAGAIVLFIGTTREFTDGKKTASLDYECYEKMAVKKLEELEQKARERWPIVDCAIVHRLGHVPLAEASIAIAVSSPHRAVAFEAGRWLIDSIKEEVPIWKKENWADGTTEWVHPSGEKRS